MSPLSIMINLLDRQVLSVMAPIIRDEFGLSNTDYSQILFAFLQRHHVSAVMFSS